jgi:hypothetical protein
MVSDSPPVTHVDFRISRNTIIVRNIFAGEVPSDGSHNDHEFIASNNEGDNPDDTEPEGVDHPVGFRGPFEILYLSRGLLNFERLFGDRTHTDEGRSPGSENKDSESEVAHRNEKDSLSVSEPISSSLNNSDRYSEIFEAADNAHIVESSDNKAPEHHPPSSSYVSVGVFL